VTAVPVEDGAPPTEADLRVARLGSAVSRLKPRGRVDLERALLIGGSVLLPLGVIVILLGWYGASRTSYDFEQMDYLISGGILGAALTVAGGFLYFGYWLTRLVHEGRRERVELAEILERIDARLAVLDPAGGVARTTLVTTATGSLVHRPTCALVANRDGLRAVDAATPGLKPCKVCEPFASDTGVGG